MSKEQLHIQVANDIEFIDDPAGIHRESFELSFDGTAGGTGIIDLENIRNIAGVDALRELGWSQAYLNAELVTFPETGDESLEDKYKDSASFDLKLILMKPDGEAGPNQTAVYAICHVDGETTEAVRGEYTDDLGEPELAYVYELGSVFEQPGKTGYEAVEISAEEQEGVEAFLGAVHAAAVDRLKQEVPVNPPEVS